MKSTQTATTPRASSSFSRFRAADHYRRDKARVQFGLILSGEKLVDNAAVRQRLRALEPGAADWPLNPRAAIAISESLTKANKVWQSDIRWAPDRVGA